MAKTARPPKAAAEREPLNSDPVPRDISTPAKRKRGRPRKHPIPAEEPVAAAEVQKPKAQDLEPKATLAVDLGASAQPKRKRGRPRKGAQDPLRKPGSGPSAEAKQEKQQQHSSRPRMERRYPAPLSLPSQPAAEPKDRAPKLKKPGSGSAGQPQHKDQVYRQAVRRVSTQIQRISQEEHLIDSYAADGWKGASREKVRLTDEIERAEQQVLRCQDIIREAVRFCEEAQGDRAISEDAFDSEGEVDADAILCGRCLEMESYDDNDIVLCDGPCNRAYHEACLSPRLVAAELPEDEGWLCPACDAKADIIHQINVYFGTDYGVETSSGQLFSDPPEEARARAMKRLRSASLEGPLPASVVAAAVAGAGPGGLTAALLGGDLPSEDETDASYTVEADDEEQTRPGAEETTCRRCSHAGASSGSREEGGSSSSDDGASSNEEDEDELASVISEEGVQLSGASSGDEAGGGSRRKARQLRSGRGGAAAGAAARSGSGGGKGGVNSPRGGKAGASSGLTREESQALAEYDLQKSPDEVVLPGKRRRAKVDYWALHEQMFGVGADAAEADNSDEDYLSSD